MTLVSYISHSNTLLRELTVPLLDYDYDLKQNISTFVDWIKMGKFT